MLYLLPVGMLINFSSLKILCKKVVIVIIGMLDDMKVKCDLLSQKKIFCLRQSHASFNASHRDAM